MQSFVFSDIVARSLLAAVPARGRAVPEREPRPAYPRLARLAVGTKERRRPADAPGRHERRAAASPSLRPAPSTLAARAWLASHRARVAQAVCATREARHATPCSLCTLAGGAGCDGRCR